jgi:hypothetical protein
MADPWRAAHPACELVVLATRPGPLNDEERLRHLVARVPDWEQCLRLAAGHGVAELVYQRLALFIAGSCPPDIWRSWTDRNRSGAVVSMARACELVRLTGEFARAQIPVLAVKGPVLGLAFYGDLALRPFEDLDLLVRPADRERAITLLCDLGYLPRYPLQGALQRGYFRRFDELHFSHSATGTLIDLHWSLLWRRYTFAAALDDLWERTATVSVGTVQIHTLGTEDLLVYLLIHAAKHGCACLAWLGDIARIMQGCAVIDWARISGTASRTGTRRLISTGIAICSRLFAIRTAQELPRSLADAADDRLVHDSCWRLLHSPRLHFPAPGRPFFFRALERGGDRLRWLHEILLEPTPPDWHAVPLPAALDWLYPLMRAARLLRKYGTFAGREQPVAANHPVEM